MAIDSSILQAKLKQFFGFDAFKGDQERIIKHQIGRASCRERVLIPV